jgi:hypothetical protein
VRRGPVLAVSLLIAAVASVEAASWRASRRRGSYGRQVRGGRTEAVIVLGYPPTRRGRLHPVQRWRCEIAVRSRDPERSGNVIFTGGDRRSQLPEAEVMAAHAQDVLGLPQTEVRLESDSWSTWEGVAFALPLVEEADVIKIASDPLHAARARSYLRQMRPDLAARLRPAEDYRVLERWWIKAAAVADAWRRAARSRLPGGTWEVRDRPDDPVRARAASRARASRLGRSSPPGGPLRRAERVRPWRMGYGVSERPSRTPSQLSRRPASTRVVTSPSGP